MNTAMRIVLMSLLLSGCDRAGSGGAPGDTDGASGGSGASTGSAGTGGDSGAGDAGSTGTGTTTTGTGTGGTGGTGGPGEPTLEEMMSHDQVFACAVDAEEAFLTFRANGTLEVEERNSAWSDMGTWKIVGDTVELSAAGVTELIESSEFYQGQIVEFQSPSLNCDIFAIPGQNLLGMTTFECSTIGFEKAFYSFNADGRAGRSTEINISFDTWLSTQGGAYWVDLPNGLIHMAFPLTDPAKDEVVESALILDDTSFEVLSPNGNQTGEICKMK